MSGPDGYKETDPSLSGKVPPPAYSEVQTGPDNPQGGYPGADQGYPPQPYPQPYMQQGYHYAPGQAPPEGGKNPEMMGAAYPPGQYPPGQYGPGQAGYPAGQPGYPPGQPGYPQGGYPPGSYPQAQAPYGQPTTSVVVTQPSGTTVLVAQNPAPDNMLLSVLACLCCFCPTGIFAIMYSCQAKSANEINDYQAALRYGQSAKKLAIASIVIGIIVMVISLILRLVVYSTATRYSY